MSSSLTTTWWRRTKNNGETNAKLSMSKAGEVLQQFYAAVVNRDLANSRRYLKDDLVFRGLFETYPNADEYLAALTKLLSVTVRLEVKKIIAEGDDAVVLFELETKAPAAATTLVAEWHQVKDGKISQVQSVFDGRPFAAMFAPSKPDGHAG
jgi:ketosteroid isomerase-like protein